MNNKEQENREFDGRQNFRVDDDIEMLLNEHF